MMSHERNLLCRTAHVCNVLNTYGQSPHNHRLHERKHVWLHRREVCLDVNTVSVWLCVNGIFMNLSRSRLPSAEFIPDYRWVLAQCDFVPLTKGSLALGTQCCLKVQYLYSHVVFIQCVCVLSWLLSDGAECRVCGIVAFHLLYSHEANSSVSLLLWSFTLGHSFISGSHSSSCYS